MNRDEFKALGDRHKAFELRGDLTLMPGLPVVARMDGRSFHTYTRGLARPYDERLSMAMVETAKYLVADTHASVAYTQSDEITLAWLNNDPSKEMLFKGRVQKLVSVLAATTTAKFNSVVQETIPEKRRLLPVFDARVWQYPTVELAAEAFLWREADATRNSLTMAAHAHYSHAELQKVGYAQKHEMLFAKGINWADYPAFFKRGTYARRENILKSLTAQELSRIPEGRRPSGPVMRSVVQAIAMPPIGTVVNAAGVLFAGEAPRTAESEPVDLLAA